MLNIKYIVKMWILISLDSTDLLNLLCFVISCNGTYLNQFLIIYCRLTEFEILFYYEMIHIIMLKKSCDVDNFGNVLGGNTTFFSLFQIDRIPKIKIKCLIGIQLSALGKNQRVP